MGERTIAECADLAAEFVFTHTDASPDVIDIVRRAVLDAYRTGWHRALADHPDKPIDPEVPRHWCAYCGDLIAGKWVGPVPQPGESFDSGPRFHLDRPQCRKASLTDNPKET